MNTKSSLNIKLNIKLTDIDETLMYFYLFLFTHLSILLYSQEELKSIASYLNLVPPKEREKNENWYRLDIDFLRELLVIQKSNLFACPFENGILLLFLSFFFFLFFFVFSTKIFFPLRFRYRDTNVERRSSRN